MDSEDQPQMTAMVTSSFAIDLFADVTVPTVEQETGNLAIEIAHPNGSPAEKEIPPFKTGDAEDSVPFVLANEEDSKSKLVLVPCDWLSFVVVVVFVCAFINVTSLVIGVPAVCFSYMAYREKLLGNYSRTKTLGYIAVILSIWDIVYSLVTMAVIVGAITFVYHNKQH